MKVTYTPVVRDWCEKDSLKCVLDMRDCIRFDWYNSILDVVFYRNDYYTNLKNTKSFGKYMNHRTTKPTNFDFSKLVLSEINCF